MTYVMATVPRKYLRAGRSWISYFESIDCHKWVVALEHGKNGLEHWQVRFKVRGCDSKAQKEAYFNEWKRRFPEGHIEFSDNWSAYERKEGFFVCSDDSREVLGIRFGVPTAIQRNILYVAGTQGDRTVDVWLDKKGNHGKSWLSLWLFEKGQGLLVPRYCTTARALSQFICSAYNGERYIIIDIPRAGKPSRDLYECIEEIKDGAVFDERYSGRMRNIRGSRVIVFTNIELDKKMLSADRWRLHGFPSARNGRKPKVGTVRE